MKCQFCNREKVDRVFYVNWMGTVYQAPVCSDCLNKMWKKASEAGQIRRGLDGITSQIGNEPVPAGTAQSAGSTGMTGRAGHAADAGMNDGQPVQDAEKENMLEKYGLDVTEKAGEGGYDPVIGREDVIERMIQILSRRTKNNPVLTGESGVGKTAVVEGLAQRAADRNVPENLHDKRIISLDLV